MKAPIAIGSGVLAVYTCYLHPESPSSQIVRFLSQNPGPEWVLDLDTLLVGHLDPEGHIYHHIPISIALLILAAIALLLFLSSHIGL